MEFPLGYFPDEVKNIVLEVCGVFNFSHEYLASAILSAAASAIGDSYCVEVKKGWTEHNSVFLAIVGRPGVNKSAPIKWALRPLQSHERKLYAQYKERIKEYQESEKDMKNLPPLIKTIMSDATPESVVSQLQKNERGVLLYVDELKGFFSSFQRYNKGNDEEFYLQTWSTSPAIVDRKTLPSIRVESPVLTIIGTIQPDVLNSVFSGAADNGFYDRWLICNPKTVKKEYWSDDVLRDQVSMNYENIINKLMRLQPDRDECDAANAKRLHYSQQASRIIYAWQRKNTDEINQAETDVIRSVRSKMEIYVHRFATITHLLGYASSHQQAFQPYSEIDEQSARRAIALADYFIVQAVEFRSGIDPMSGMPVKWKEFYDSLPGSDMPFESAYIYQHAYSHGISESSLKRWIKSNLGKTITKIKHGTYAKI